MGFMKNKRIRQVIKYGWKDAGEISGYSDVNKSRISIFLDIWGCFRKYYVFSNQYKSKQFWLLSENERFDMASKMGAANKEKDKYIDVHYSDWKFLSKYTALKWQNSPKRIKQRTTAYIKHFGLGEDNAIQYGVSFICEHFSIGEIKCGKNVLFARDVDIDYTGDLTIEDNVKISEGVKILTHNHNVDFTQRNDLGHGLIKTPLFIRDNVGIGARAVIMPDVNEIGRRAMISTSAVVKRQVPPYAIVMGNPARVVGFRYPPAMIAEFEEENYSEKERIPLAVLEENYKKYYLDKLQEIKQFLG